MKAKKIITLLLAAAMSTSMLASCGDSAKDGQVTFSVGDWPAKKGENLDNANEQKAGFEAKYPEYKLKGDTWSFDLKTFYPKAEAGTLPNLFYTHFSEFQKIYDGGYAADITDIMQETGYYENMNPILRDLVSRDGKVYGFPTNAYAVGLIFNVSLLKEAGYINADGTPHQPKDWFEMAEMAQHIKEVTGVPGFVLETSSNCGGWFMTNIGWSFGVDWMEQQADGTWKATFDTQEAADTLQFIKDLKWKYNCVPDNNIVDQAEAQKLYATGQAAMFLDGPLGAQLSKYEMDPKDYGIMAIPAGPVKHVSLLGGTVQFLSNNSTPEQQKGVFAWLDYKGTSYKINEDAKMLSEKSYQTKVNEGQPIGVKALSPWSDDSETVKFDHEMIDKYTTVIPASVKLYNEAIRGTEIELQAEEPVCCQDLYGVLDNIIQEVYSNENADCAALVKQANDDFQKNFLDKLDY